MVVYVQNFEDGSLVVPSTFWPRTPASTGMRPVVIFPKITQPIITVGCRPETGSMNLVGDKPCLHHNWKGTIFRTKGWSHYDYEERGATAPYPHFELLRVTRWVGESVGGSQIGYDFALPFTPMRYDRKPYRYGSSTMIMVSDLRWSGSISSGIVLVLDRQYYSDVRTSTGTINLVSYRESLLEFSNFDAFGVPHRYRKKSISKNTLQPFDAFPVPEMVMDPSIPYNTILPTEYTTGWTVGTDVDTRPKAQEFLELMNVVYTNVLSDFSHTSMWEDLCVQSIQSARHLDINTGMFARDLVKIKELIKPFIALLDGISAKDLANGYLTWKYGASLTYRDGRSLITELISTVKDVARTKLFDSCRSRQRVSGTLKRLSSDPYDIFYNYKVYYTNREDTFSKVIQSLMSWDLFPSLANVWDAIPYSFVLDWFVPIQDALERIDSRTYAAVLDVISVCRTYKLVTQLSFSTWEKYISYVGWKREDTYAHLSYTRYSRENTSILDRPSFRVGQPGEFHNIAELTSIIVQKF